MDADSTADDKLLWRGKILPAINNLLLNVFIILLFIIGSFTLNHLFKGKYTQRTAGILYSLAAILCMSFPFKLLPGQIYDLRIVVLLIAILYGGYGAGLFVVAITFLYRYILGGSGFIQMVLTFLPILAVAFYLLPHYRRYARLHKIALAMCLSGSIVALNIIFVVARYSVTRLHLIFLLEWALIEALGIALMVFMIEIMNDNIAMTRKMQEVEKQQLVTALTASIAHEIRNPLTVCSGFIQLLREMITDEKQLKYTNTVLSELKRASSIIDNYLSISKPKIDKIERMDTAQIVAQTIEAILPFSRTKSVEIQQRLEEKLLIQVDLGKFKQSLFNVMKNGIEAMTDGGILSVEVRRHNQMAVVDIIDTGIGMTKEQMNRLGNPFYSTKATGTGLGLMTSYRFIQIMKGNIEVTSEPGQGTHFFIFVPLTNGFPRKTAESNSSPEESTRLLYRSSSRS
jgi:two-component system, sporulation sensor kinase B